MGRYGTIDYPVLTKRTFIAGLALFVFAVVGEFVGHAVYGSLPGWEETLLFDAEVLGLLVAFFGPLVFGVVMPLTE